MEEKRIELIKQYVESYMNIVESIEGEYLSKRAINRKIAKNWNVPYDLIKELSKESLEIYNNTNPKEGV